MWKEADESRGETREMSSRNEEELRGDEIQDCRPQFTHKSNLLGSNWFSRVFCFHFC